LGVNFAPNPVCLLNAVTPRLVGTQPTVEHFERPTVFIKPKKSLAKSVISHTKLGFDLY